MRWLLRSVTQRLEQLLHEMRVQLLEDIADMLPEIMTNEAERAAKDARRTEARVRRLAKQAGDVAGEEDEDGTGELRLPFEGEDAAPNGALDADIRQASLNAMFGRGR